LTEILASIGFTVHDAANGMEAMQRVQQEKMDLALVDWNMPGMNGCEFIRKVRKNNAYKNMRMMMVTTETEINKVAEALDAGADEYIMKSFTKEMIVEKLALMGIDVPSASS